MFPLNHIPLTAPRGVFRPCRWCRGTLGRIEAAPLIEPARHAGRMICEDCLRQTGWVSARALRKTEKIVFQSDGDAVAAVTGKAQLANAAGVEPSPSEFNSSRPLSSWGMTDKPELAASGSGDQFIEDAICPARDSIEGRAPAVRVAAPRLRRAA